MVHVFLLACSLRTCEPRLHLARLVSRDDRRFRVDFVIASSGLDRFVAGWEAGNSVSSSDGLSEVRGLFSSFSGNNGSVGLSVISDRILAFSSSDGVSAIVIVLKELFF